LLDEFTASLDPQTESTVIATIKAQRPTVTVVLATHQQALVDIADVVYRLEGKRATKLVAST
jgi:ABC-type transport system involved in cytochrome bd biosynthesis fused ATPase/permease subunit